MKKQITTNKNTTMYRFRNVLNSIFDHDSLLFSNTNSKKYLKNLFYILRHPGNFQFFRNQHRTDFLWLPALVPLLVFTRLRGLN